MSDIKTYLLALVLIFIPLYPKFPLVSVSGTFVAIRLEDVLLAFVAGIFTWGLIKNRGLFEFTPLSRALLLYLTVGLIASFSGIFLTRSSALTQGFLHYFRRLEYMSLFFVGYAWLKGLKQVNFLVRVVLMTSLLVAVYGLGQQFFGFPVVTTTNSEFSKGLALTLGQGARINSTFAGHYDLAAFSVFPLFLIIALLPFASRKLPLLVLAALVYWTLLLSASRITFASFFLSAAVLLLIIRRPLWLLPLAAAAIIGVVVSPQLLGRYRSLITNHLKISLVSTVSAQETGSKDVNDTPDALKPPLVPEDRSFNIRLRVEWPRALRAVSKNPVLGTGFSSVGLAVDNDYLRSLAESGILGLAAFLLIIARYFKTSLPLIISYRQDLCHAFVISVTCSLFSLLINAVFIDVFAASKIAVFTWLCLGLTEKTKALIRQ
ncbi:MAG: hypothetical protein UX87_C0001G0021 [Candidatus Amesbacteria bacterium GW2011_GWA1_47_16]|uniref:O-antigen ligase-related domain-containing protein n=4 Tax=Candidatus Amesiibacteriota TaxID=1752730 RepID=A0A1F4ZW95_9BACT|nr:MAG: hypothetical protein UX87_C0001G0021 [Candidatus Amesbacteria bacterium GW2011_GWA1_47_16]KKU97818.1 MAG: hypothetical protein UY28_C0013G0020 [Candidatus Amesbacteria bacterium GW2011_GWB1_48_13]OGC99171.1 MAG: hypothetical protein A2701_02070 [Candidatus Amesbacteria bacterium RIFCSPHIGHO2_01_FULL_47_34]OGD00938.1 MAG: hypothetical protein A2972_03140 [Candidatus Amesbacteria bacterium RIFCSPLOWO2_01_FULL_47_33]OGD10723.1 MAG: hypothetical protein A2395_03005 [Candidatus Amesbacteria 